MKGLNKKMLDDSTIFFTGTNEREREREVRILLTFSRSTSHNKFLMK